MFFPNRNQHYTTSVKVNQDKLGDLPGDHKLKVKHLVGSWIKLYMVSQYDLFESTQYKPDAKYLPSDECF